MTEGWKQFKKSANGSGFVRGAALQREFDESVYKIASPEAEDAAIEIRGCRAAL